MDELLCKVFLPEAQHDVLSICVESVEVGGRTFPASAHPPTHPPTWLKAEVHLIKVGVSVPQSGLEPGLNNIITPKDGVT